MFEFMTRDCVLHVQISQGFVLSADKQRISRKSGDFSWVDFPWDLCEALWRTGDEDGFANCKLPDKTHLKRKSTKRRAPEADSAQ